MFHEKAFIETFIILSKKERYLFFIKSSKGRIKFLHKLDHFNDLITSYVHQIPHNQQSITKIEILLREKGAPAMCYSISLNREIDGQELSLKAALEETVGRNIGTLLSCIPGKLVYMENEGFHERYILYKDY